MSWITWSEKQATGHREMDHGHMQLVGLINQLAHGMENSKPREFCSQTLDQLIEQIRIHFRAEEQLMDLHRYPKANEHRALHAMLARDVLAFKESYDSGQTSEFVTLLVILDSWLERDIIAADKALADFLAVAG
jgi:hemerythrin-like metal-binding protein